MKAQIGLTRLIAWFSRRWPLMLLFAIIGLAASGVVLAVQPTKWSANSTVAIVREKSQFNFDPHFVTSQDNWADRVVQRETLRNLALTSAVEIKVIDELAQLLPDNYQNPGELVSIIQVNYPPNSNLLLIEATAESPTLSVTVADTWAHAFVSYANALYGVNEFAISQVEKELLSAQIAYDQAETRLSDFIGTNQIDELNVKITQLFAILDAYSTLAVELTVIADEIDKLGEILQNPDVDPLASRWSLVLIQTRLMGIAENTGAKAFLQFDLSLPDTEVNAETDIARQKQNVSELGRVVSEWRKQVEDAIADPIRWEELRDMKMEKNKQQAMLDQLTADRDIEKEALEILSRKAREVAIAASTKGTEVRMASSAQGTEKSDLMAKVAQAAFAGVLAFFLGSVFLLARDGL